MRTRHAIVARAGAVVLTLAAAGAAMAPLALSADAATPHYRAPVAKPLPDPGVVKASSGTWVVLSTGSWKSLHVGTSASQDGPYAVRSRPLLTHRAAWMSTTDSSVWAPSIVETSPGQFAVYYAGVVKGTKGRRCIGSATTNVDLSTSLRKGFVPADRPVACWDGSGTGSYDKVRSEGSTFGMIDATPAWIDGQLVLTYKTEFKAKGSSTWHTTTRLVQLDPAHPGQTGGAHASSIRIANSRSKVIEENPVLVKHGARYTLFTSYGLFGRCGYTTRYRQNENLWTGWKGEKPHSLTFPRARTCGTGNAQVIAVPGTDQWRIFFNGHLDHKKNPHAVHSPRGPQGMYVANLTWSHGRPKVGAYVKG